VMEGVGVGGELSWGVWLKVRMGVYCLSFYIYFGLAIRHR
jgi:hypothetical protein